MIFTMFNLGAWSANLSENVCKILYSRGSCKVQWYIKSQEICTEEKRGIKVYRLVCNRLLKMATSLKIRLQTCLYIEPYTKLCLTDRKYHLQSRIGIPRESYQDMKLTLKDQFSRRFKSFRVDI